MICIVPVLTSSAQLHAHIRLVLPMAVAITHVARGGRCFPQGAVNLHPTPENQHNFERRILDKRTTNRHFPIAVYSVLVAPSSQVGFAPLNRPCLYTHFCNAEPLLLGAFVEHCMIQRHEP